MILGRKYDQEFLKDLFKYKVERYLLFEKLEEFIINSPSTVQIENKTNIVEAYRIALNLPRFDFPYWEIHFYKNGFYNLNAGTLLGPGGQKLMVPNEIKEQTHLYFTFKSLIKPIPKSKARHFIYPKEDYEIYEMNKEPGIDNEYTGKISNKQGIWLVVLDDARLWKISDYLSDKIISGAELARDKESIMKCFKDAADVELKDLPQVMYLSEGSTFNYKTKNPENVIVMQDMFSSITAPNLTGSVYLHNSSILFQGFKDSHCGKNIVIGRDSEISSSYIGDNVLIGNRVIADRHSEIHDDVFIENGVRINEYQEIPAGQSLTANPPELMRLFKANRYELDQFERRTTNPY